MAGLKVPYRHRWVGRVENARGVLLKTIRLVLLWRHTHASCKPVSKVTSTTVLEHIGLIEVPYSTVLWR